MCDSFRHEHCIWSITIFQKGVVEGAIIELALLEVIKIVRASGVDNIVSNNNRTFPYCSQALQEFKIRQVQVLQVVNENQIERPMILYKGTLRLNSTNVDLNSVRNTGMLMNLACHVCELNTGINCMDDAFGGMGHDK